MNRIAISTVLILATLSWPCDGRAQSSDTSYTIVGGSYAGTSVSIRRSSALRKGSRFWRVAPRTDGRLVGWNPSKLPVGVAFRTGRGITPDDSVAFWGILRGMEQDLGMHVFEPATVAAGQDPDDVIVVDTRQMGGDEGLTLVTWSNSGLLYDARVFLRSRGTLHDGGIVQHEMMHALGFGHTAAWPSILNASPAVKRLTPEDVAYTQLALQSRAESERIDMWDRIALAVERETPAHPANPGNDLCDPFTPNATDSGGDMRVKQLAGMTLIGVLTACSAGDKNRKGPDTIAVPAAAVDTTTDRTAGVTPRATGAPATGVDTPITKKIGAPAPAKR